MEVRMRLSFSLWLSILGFVLPSGVEAAMLLEVERVVLGSSFVDAAVVYSGSDQVGFGSAESGGFLEAAVGGARYIDVINVITEATQDSDVAIFAGGGLRVAGSGAVGVGFDVDDPGYPSRAQGSADSTLSILFEVTSPSAFSLAVSLSAELAQLSIFSGGGPVESDLSAYARLLGLTTGTVLEVSVEDDVVDDIVATEARLISGILLPDTYLFEIGATTYLRGFEDAAGLATAGFGLDFHIVPEPGTGMLVGLGLALLARTRARER
jgi:hypothetical protein